MRLRGLLILSLAILLSISVFSQEQGIDANNNDQFEVAQIELFPNPAVDFVVVQIKNRDLQDPEIELRSMIGNKLEIEVEKVSMDRYRVPLKDLASGYYFLIVKDEFLRFKKAVKFLKR